MKHSRLLGRRQPLKSKRIWKARPMVELLEDRTTPSNGQWMAVFEGITPGETHHEQVLNTQSMLLASGVSQEAVTVMSALDFSGTVVVQTPLDVTLEGLTQQLQVVPGFIFAENYELPGPDAAEIRQIHPLQERTRETPPLPYEDFLILEKNGLIPDQRGPVEDDPALADVLTNNNAGAGTTANFTQSETTLVAFGNTVVIGFNDSGSFVGGASKFTGWSRSTDGGTTFVDGGTLPTNPNGDAGDPVMARNNTTGRVYYSTLQFSGSGIRMFRSDDNGASWLAPTNAAPGSSGFQDKQWITVDNFAGPGNGNVYHVVRDFGGGNGIRFYRSLDHGTTFTPNGGLLIASGSPSNVQGCFVVVTPDHGINVFWFDENASPETIKMRRSTDFGVSFGAPVTVATLGTGPGFNGDLQLTGRRQGLTTFSGFRSNAFAHAVVNPISGHIYATYADNPAGVDKANIYMVMSTNLGATWSAPFQVNDDATTRDQWQPTLAVTPDGGKLGIFYYSRQEDVDNNLFKYRGRIANIVGPVLTWAPSFNISEVASLPEFGRDGVVNSVYMGDYDTAAATPGAFHVIWSDSRDNHPLPAGAPRKDPNVYYKRIALGLTVSSTVPAAGTAVSSVPVDYVVNFSDPINGATVQATDFTVTNNVGVPVPADSFLMGSPTQVTFRYSVAPFTNQGPHTMAMAAGSVLRAGDSDPLQAFSGTFHFDTLGLAVTTTVPAPGGTFTLPAPFTYVVNFNENIAASSVGTDDLILSAGTVTAAVASGPAQATYTIGGITLEQTLSITVAAGRLTDTFGNPNPANFVASYNVDIGVIPYPTPLVAKLPLGSLVYDPIATGIIAPGTDTDSFTLNIDPEQQITVVVRPTVATLRPTIEVIDPDGLLIASETAPAVNRDVIVQSIATTSSGVYMFTVGSAGGTTGSYSIQVFLNGYEEFERHTGYPTNNTPATAEPIDSAFLILGGAANRAAVLGTVGTAADLDFYNFFGTAGDTLTVALKGLTTTNVNVQVRDGSGVTILAHGVPGPSNLDRVLTDFLLPADDLYYVVVSSSTAGAQYDLVLTRNAEFNTEPNNAIAQGQPFTSQQLFGEQWALGHVSASLGDAADIYRVNLGAGATLDARTFTPAGGPGQFVNTFNPRLRVLNSSGAQVAFDDNSAPDGRNALLSFTNPGAAGVFFVEVSSTTAFPLPTVGEYLLRVSGNTVTLPPFQVTTTVPANGATLLTSPTIMTVNFNDAVLLSSVQASDLKVDGINATAFTVVDGDTINFNLPPGFGPGTHSVTIAAGAIQDVQGTNITAYSGTFIIDNVAPRVTATNIAPGAVLAPGSLSYQVTFSEAMRATNLSADDFQLRGNFRAVNYGASSFSYNAARTVVTLNYTGLPDDNYSLTLIAGVSGGPNFTDAAGNALDGEFSGTFPSGNGVPGGNFVISFNMDLATEAYPTPLGSKSPLGSMIYDPSLIRTIAFAGDSDSYTLAVDPGQTITVVVTPNTAALRPSAELRDPANTLLASNTAAAVGQAALLQTIATTTGGTYRITVGAASGTGLYTLQVILNAAQETESIPGGGTNNTLATAQNINASFLNLQAGAASALRGGGLGTTDPTAGYAATAVPFAFEDISATGTRLTSIEGFDDTFTSFNPGALGFSFNLYGTTHSTIVFVSTNGLLTFASGTAAFTNSSLQFNPAQATIAALWDDLDTFSGARVFWEVRGSGADQRLIVQWHNLHYLGLSDPITFQAILFENGNQIRYNYLDLIGGSPGSNEGASATVGIKRANPTAGSFLNVANPGPNAFVGTGKSTVIAPVTAGGDHYQFTLAAGETATLAVTGQAGGNLNLELLNSGGGVIATGVAAGNVTRIISNHAITAAGTYYARISGDGLVPYSLVVNRNAAFDTEANDAFATAQNITGTQGVLGHVIGGSTTSIFDLTGTTYTGGLTLTGTRITLGINADGSFINGAIGIRFNGIEHVVPGSPIASFTVSRNGQNFTNNAAAGVSQITITNRQNLSAGTLRGVRIVGTAGGNLQVERVVVFNQNDDFVTIGTRLTNLSAATMTGVATMESFDPDQDFDTFGRFDTANDVVLGNQFVRASGPVSNRTVGLGSSDSRSVVSAEGFQNFNPFDIINSPVDPNGALGDIAINQAFNMGSLATGARTAGLTIMAFGNTPAAADAVFSANSGGTALANEDWHAVSLAADQGGLNIQTSTPADGPNQFVNTLNPKIELYSPSNVLLFSGVVGPDGRNESINATGLIPGGTYRIRVVGEGGTRGEYFLGVTPTQTTRAPIVLVANDTSTPGNDVIIVDNLPAGTPTPMGNSTHDDADDRLGVVLHLNPVGNFPIATLTAAGAPFVSNQLVVEVEALSNVAGVLEVWASVSGFAGVAGSNTVLSEIGGITDGEVTFTEFVDTSNRRFPPPGPGVHQVTQGPFSGGAFAASAPITFSLTAASPYSITKYLRIEHTTLEGSITGLGAYGKVATGADPDHTGKLSDTPFIVPEESWSSLFNSSRAKGDRISARSEFLPGLLADVEEPRSDEGSWLRKDEGALTSEDPGLWAAVFADFELAGEDYDLE